MAEVPRAGSGAVLPRGRRLGLGLLAHVTSRMRPLGQISCWWCIASIGWVAGGVHAQRRFSGSTRYRAIAGKLRGGRSRDATFSCARQVRVERPEERVDGLDVVGVIALELPDRSIRQPLAEDIDQSL